MGPGIGLHGVELAVDRGEIVGERCHRQLVRHIGAAAVGSMDGGNRLAPFRGDGGSRRGVGQVIGVLTVLGAARPGAGAGLAFHILLGQGHPDMVREGHEAKLDICRVGRRQVVHQILGGVAHGDVFDFAAEHVLHRAGIVEHQDDFRLLFIGNADFAFHVHLHRAEARELHEAYRQLQGCRRGDRVAGKAEIAGRAGAVDRRCHDIFVESRLARGDAGWVRQVGCRGNGQRPGIKRRLQGDLGR